MLLRPDGSGLMRSKRPGAQSSPADEVPISWQYQGGGLWIGTWTYQGYTSMMEIRLSDNKLITEIRGLNIHYVWTRAGQTGAVERELSRTSR